MLMLGCMELHYYLTQAVVNNRAYCSDITGHEE